MKAVMKHQHSAITNLAGILRLALVKQDLTREMNQIVDKTPVSMVDCGEQWWLNLLAGPQETPVLQ